MAGESPAEADADAVLDVSHLTTGYGDVQVVDEFNAVVRDRKSVV